MQNAKLGIRYGIASFITGALAIVMENLRQYADRVDRALSKGEPINTFNQDLFHAIAIFVAVFKYAKEEVLLLSNKLDLIVYGNPGLLQTMEGFLRDRHGSLRILVESDIDRDHPVVQLSADKSCKVSIRRIPEDEQGGYKHNFLVMDKTGYRFERDRAEPAAFADFNSAGSETTATKLRELFDSLSSKSQELPLLQ